MSERQPITEGDEEATPTKSQQVGRDGAVPCMALTALLIAVVMVGSIAIGIAIAAFDPKRASQSNAFAASFHSETISADVWMVRSSVSWAEVVAGLSNGTLGTQLNEIIALSPHAAFYWETPPLTKALAPAITFSFVTVRAPSLTGTEDGGPFAKQLASCTSGSSDFPNLGGDAQLVAPCGSSGKGTYAHLGSFVRTGREEEHSAFWQRVGAALNRTLEARGSAPTWVSTEGSGVAWTHLRLDTSPKYFHYEPFRKTPEVQSSRR